MQDLLFQVEKIESRNFEALQSDEKEILKSFHIQLSVNPVCFSVYGIFVIDLSLLVRILTGIISFQIILVQFHANKDQCNDTVTPFLASLNNTTNT